VTIADGFSHRTGLYGLSGDDLEDVGFQREVILSRLQYMQSYGPFRSSYSYSNYGITAAAVSASNAVGLEWADAAQDYLYGPLGMNSSTSNYTTFLSRTNRAALHIPTANDTNTSTVNSWQAAQPRNPTPQAPAGGATSSANDLAKWLQLHLAFGEYEGRQLIAQAAINETRIPHIVNAYIPSTSQVGYYGLGWVVDYDVDSGDVYISHAGAFSQGARTVVKMSPQNGLGIVVLANCFPTGWPDAIADTFFDLVLNRGVVRKDYVTYWNDRYFQLVSEGDAENEFKGSPPSGVGSASLGSGAYVGDYVNEYVGTVTIASGGNGTRTGTDADLVLSFPGSSNLSFPLSHWDRDTFVMTTQGDNPTGAVTFAIGPDGNASTVTIESLNGNGGGVLTRIYG
jgi:CubicO group peptidase (beta-lactamase class C family)